MVTSSGAQILSVLYYRSTDSLGNAAFWAVPVSGGRPRLLLRLDSALRPSRRIEFSTNGARLFFTLAGDEASIWRLELTP